MRRGSVLLLAVFFVAVLFAQHTLYMFKNDATVVSKAVADVDSIVFQNQEKMAFYKGGILTDWFEIAAVDSVAFGGLHSDTVLVTYSGSGVVVENPFAQYGVTATVNGGDVVIRSQLTSKKINYLLKGTCTDGSFKLYSNYRSDLILSGVNLTNSDGPAINIQSGKRCEVTVDTLTTNVLTDGSSYASGKEDQKAAFFSEGQLIFKGGGSLSLNGNYKHALCSDDFIEIRSANLTVNCAKKNGIMVNDRFLMEGGTVSLTVAEAGAKAVKSGGPMLLNGGSITVKNTGSTTLESSGSGYDPSYATGLKSDSSICLNGTTVNINCSGTGGKGISSDMNVEMNAGTVEVITSGGAASYVNSLGKTDAYSASAIDADADIRILGGTLTTNSSGTGGKGLTADGNLQLGTVTNSPTVNVTTSGTRYLVSGVTNYTTAVYSTPKAVKSDGAMLIVNGDITVVTSQPGGNAIESDSTLTMNGGTVKITLNGNGTKGLKSAKDMSLNAGTVTVTAKGALVLENVAAATYEPAYCTAIKSDAAILANGTGITITHTGAGGKGLSATTSLNVSSGVLVIGCSGAGTTYTNASGTKDSYCSSCITSDGTVLITGGKITTTTGTSAAGAKGISADGVITIGSATSSPELSITTAGSRFAVSGTDYCHPKTLVSPKAIAILNGTNTFTSTDDGIHSDASVTISGGKNTVTASSSTSGVGEGVEAPIITFDGGTTIITASNDGINATYGTQSGGTESNDNSQLYIKGGIVVVNGSDAVDSNGSITISGGTTIVNGPTNQPEEGMDFNGSLTVTGGYLISGGSNSNMTKSFTTATQPCMYIKAGTSIAAGTILHIESAAGAEMLTIKLKNANYYFHFTSPSLAKGTQYKIMSGGSYTGGSFAGGTSGYGLYTGGTYSSTGATTKSTTTLSTSSFINTITF